jgi:hypothetical protein
VTGILAVTADAKLRAGWFDCAARAGAHLLYVDSVAAARTAWKSADLVLLGADQAQPAVRARLPYRSDLILIDTDALTVEAFRTGEQLRVSYVAILPTGRDWLADRLRPAGNRVLQRLHAAGFSIGYACRDRAIEQGFVRPLGWDRHPGEDRPHPFVSFADVARGECTAGQSTTVQRSNMRRLPHVFPGVFTDLAFSNTTVLGAFACDLSAEVVDVLCRLAREYPIFDEDDLATMEHEEAVASWQQWLACDVRAGLGKRAAAVWDDLDDGDREALWWDTVTGLDAMPEHDGRTLRWPLWRLTGAYAARLTAEGRRRAETARRAAAAPHAAEAVAR